MDLALIITVLLVTQILTLLVVRRNFRARLEETRQDSLDAAWAEVEETLWSEAMELREDYGQGQPNVRRHSLEWINGFEYAAGRVTWLRKDINDNSEHSWPFDSETEAP